METRFDRYGQNEYWLYYFAVILFEVFENRKNSGDLPEFYALKN